MWINPLFDAPALDAVRALVAGNSLATIVAAHPLRAAHLPLLLEVKEDGSLILTGHVPLADPLSAAVHAGDRLLCVFHGPRAYVSAGWYAGPGLPTYNFTVAHLAGVAEAIPAAALRAHLLDLIRAEEARKPGPGGAWQPPPDALDRIDALLPVVAGFRVAVDEAQAKAKLGQNRTRADRLATIAHLADSPVAEHQAVADAMRQAEDPPPPGPQGH